MILYVEISMEAIARAVATVGCNLSMQVMEALVGRFIGVRARTWKHICIAFFIHNI